MKKITLYLFILTILVNSTTAYSKPPISEYTEIPQGLLLDHKENVNTNYSNDIFSSLEDNSIASTLSMNDIIEKFNQKKYIEIKDDVKAKAEQGTILAAKMLGIMYKEGYGMEVNSAEALKWLSKAAEASDPEAQQHLGLMYYKGDSINKNIAEALKWLKIASLIVEDEVLKESILKNYKTVLISANRRQKLTAAEKVKKWLEENNKGSLLE